MLTGVITAMLTPFDENENIDYESTKKLIDLLIKKRNKWIIYSWY